MKIEQIRIKNFKALRDVEIRNIPAFSVFVGANGSGKSTLFKVFQFLRDAMNADVHTALVKQGGSKGFAEVRSRGAEGNIEIEIKFRAKASKKNNPLITYSLSIGQQGNKAIVAEEALRYRRASHGQPWNFLNFKNGSGDAVTNEGLETVKEEKDLKREPQKLVANNILAIKGLAQFEKFPAVVALGDLIGRWHLSDIHIGKARAEQEAGLAEHLSSEGENLSLVIDYLHQNHPDTLTKITDALQHRVPGISGVSAQTIETGQILLKLKDREFQEPFLVRFVSDGTIKVLAYLVLLHDPVPHPLLCVEEPENQLYHTLLVELAEEFRQYARRGGQVFVSTHSPDFLDAVELDEVFFLIKKNGYTTIKRASKDAQLSAYMKNGDKMGVLWQQGFFQDVAP